jgi:hypothetical protein
LFVADKGYRPWTNGLVEWPHLEAILVEHEEGDVAVVEAFGGEDPGSALEELALALDVEQVLGEVERTFDLFGDLVDPHRGLDGLHRPPLLLFDLRPPFAFDSFPVGYVAGKPRR